MSQEFDLSENRCFGNPAHPLNLAHPLSHVDSDGVGRARVVEEDGRGVDARSDVRQGNAFAGLHLLLVYLEFVSTTGLNPEEAAKTHFKIVGQRGSIFRMLRKLR